MSSHNLVPSTPGSQGPDHHLMKISPAWPASFLSAPSSLLTAFHLILSQNLSENKRLQVQFFLHTERRKDMVRITNLLGMAVHTFIPSTGGKSRQIPEFKVNLLYLTHSQTSVLKTNENPTNLQIICKSAVKR